MVAAACATARPRAAFTAAARPARRSVRVQASGAVALPDSITKARRPVAERRRRRRLAALRRPAAARPLPARPAHSTLPRTFRR